VQIRDVECCGLLLSQTNENLLKLLINLQGSVTHFGKVAALNHHMDHSNEENIYVAMERAILAVGLGLIALALVGEFGIGF
jgi:hypothetical protein